VTSSPLDGAADGAGHGGGGGDAAEAAVLAVAVGVALELAHLLVDLLLQLLGRQKLRTALCGDGGLVLLGADGLRGGKRGGRPALEEAVARARVGGSAVGRRPAGGA